MKAFLHLGADPAPGYLCVFEKMKKFGRRQITWLFAFLVVCFAAGASFGATFPADAPSLGAIPDSNLTSPTCQNASTTFKDITFTVTGLSGPVSTAVVSFSASHTYLQDLEVSLRGPSAVPSHLLFSATGTTSTVVGTCAGSSNDLSTANTYTFSDGVFPNWWTTAATNPVPTSTNRTVVTGIGGTSNPPATTSLNTTFAGTPPNGTWSLRFRDRGAGDTGTVTAASLTLTTLAPLQHVVDFNGDGKTDWTIVRNFGGGPNGKIVWITRYNGGGDQINKLGAAGDFFLPGDYDGDNRTDEAVWRPGAPGVAAWYILQSVTNTLRSETFGQTGDDPEVFGDYDGDNKDDLAVYRPGAVSGAPSFWYWRSSVSPGPLFNVQWGQQGDFVAPGDYDGDGKNDFVVQRNAGGGQARFWRLMTTNPSDSVVFGTPTDTIVPGDYDGDGKTDIALTRGIGGNLIWFVLPSLGGPYTQTTFGLVATDYQVQGDYDGDGKTDIAVWRPNLDPTMCFFYVNNSTGGIQTFEWGVNGDYPPANYNTH
jgi:subtilisin-like proprotein convertase family protein